ncbi:MAG: SpoIVB peptidase S55 domain-containing protein [bacterium]
MKFKSLICTAALLFAQVIFARQDIMPVDQIKPGMRGVGKTVFSGDTIEEFEFEIIEIIPNFKAKRDLILAKLLGLKVEHTGVVAGMSGSPMYIDGKLIGALSYSMGIFMKDAIAGITPIEQMFEILTREKVRPEELAAGQGFNPNYLAMAVGAREISWENLLPPELRKVSSAPSGITQINLLPTPLIFSGFESSTLDFLSTLFSGMPLQIMHGGGVFKTGEVEIGPLQPGSAYSVVIVDGDFGLQATGTVTYRDENTVLGMGHPFLNTGAIGLPMGKAKIITTLASLMLSTKMAALSEIVGTVHQDRTTGVMGVSGEQAQMIPVHFRFRSKYQDTAELNFRIAEDRRLHSLTPFIFTIVLTNALESARLSQGNHTLKLDGKINLAKDEAIPLKNYFAGSTPTSFLTDAMEASGEISSTIGTLLSNDFETPQIESVELNFDALYQKNLARVERIEVDRTVVKPGDDVRVSVFAREYQGQEHRLDYTLTIPKNIRERRLVIYAGGGSTLTRLEARSSPQKFRPKSFEQLTELLKNKRKNNFVFIQVRVRDAGVLVAGQELPSLPPSILSVMNAQKSSGNVGTLRDRILLEDEIEVNYSLSGGKTVVLTVEQTRK